MQREDGSTFHKVSGLTWPGFDISPDTDKQDRYIFSTATSSSAMYGASLAIASRVYEQYDKDYAKNLKQNAEAVWQYLEKILNQFIVLMKDKKMVQAHIIKIQILKNVYG